MSQYWLVEGENRYNGWWFRWLGVICCGIKQSLSLLCLESEWKAFDGKKGNTAHVRSEENINEIQIIYDTHGRAAAVGLGALEKKYIDNDDDVVNGVKKSSSTTIRTTALNDEVKSRERGKYSWIKMEILTTNVYCVEHGKESVGWIFLLLLHSVRKFHVFCLRGVEVKVCRFRHELSLSCECCSVYLKTLNSSTPNDLWPKSRIWIFLFFFSQEGSLEIATEIPISIRSHVNLSRRKAESIGDCVWGSSGGWGVSKLKRFVGSTFYC